MTGSTPDRTASKSRPSPGRTAATKTGAEVPCSNRPIGVRRRRPIRLAPPTAATAPHPPAGPSVILAAARLTADWSRGSTSRSAREPPRPQLLAHQPTDRVTPHTHARRSRHPLQARTRSPARRRSRARLNAAACLLTFLIIAISARLTRPPGRHTDLCHEPPNSAR